jgi:hypothetical protein
VAPYPRLATCSSTKDFSESGYCRLRSGPTVVMAGLDPPSTPRRREDWSPIGVVRSKSLQMQRFLGCGN